MVIKILYIVILFYRKGTIWINTVIHCNYTVTHFRFSLNWNNETGNLFICQFQPKVYILCSLYFIHICVCVSICSSFFFHLKHSFSLMRYSHSTRWKNTWGKSLSVMATLPTTLYTRTWRRISLPKKMRTKMVSYPPESLLTNMMNFKVSFCAMTHSLTHSSSLFISSWWKYFGALEFIAKTLSGYLEVLCLCDM